MTDYRRPPSHDCPPVTDNPAPKPKPPANGSTCQPIPPTTPPTLEPPAKCPPDPYCKCPTPPGSTPNCLEDLITNQGVGIVNAEKATKFKTELEDVLKQAKLASQKYTRTKYDELVKQWVEQDAAIALLIQRLVCIVPCWRCVIECYICPLLNELQYSEQWLYDDGKLYTDVHDLYDLQYWHTRDKQAKERRLGWIQNVLNAWTKPLPAETIENTLKANKELINAISGAMGGNSPKAIYDVFLKLVPRHLAIAPPEGTPWKTKIDKEYTEFCPCDDGDPDDCCGPDVGRMRLRDRLIGPLPYLIDPNDYYTLVCCIVDKRLKPAKEDATKAESELNSVNARITLHTTTLANWTKTFEDDAKGAIPSEIDCCDYDPRDSGSRPPQAR